MVRLKESICIHPISNFFISIPYGAIKRKGYNYYLNAKDRFQFLMVRLKEE